MNRRNFLKKCTISLIGLNGLKSLANTFDMNNLQQETELDDYSEVRDLILWAPFQAFLPGDTKLNLSNPKEGTRMGILKASDIMTGKALTLKYWHNHGNQIHYVTITEEHLALLQSGQPTVLKIPTTVAEGHLHVLLIDTKNPASSTEIEYN